MQHFRDLLTPKSRIEYLLWRITRLRHPLELHLKNGLRVQVRPLPAEDYGTAMEVFLDKAYQFPGTHPLDPPQHIVDLGSNIGCTCLYWLHQFPTSRVVAFEPHPVHAELLRSNLARNSMSDRVTLHQAAAGNHFSKAFLTDQGLSSRVVNGGGSRPAGSEIQIVDIFSALGSAPIDILKIDIETSEYQILADERFAGLPAKTVVMEWHPTERFPGESGAQWCRQRLTECGYDVIHELAAFRVLWAVRR